MRKIRGLLIAFLWKPSVNGKAVITASVAPTTGSFSAITSPPLTVFVQRRSGLR